MKKAIKITLWTLAAIVLFLILALLAHPLWIGGTAKLVANKVVPGITGTRFNLGDFGLNLYSGSLRVGGVELWNPEGFDDEYAFTLGSLGVDVDVGSAASDTIVIHDITIRDVFASYVDDDNDRNNFATIAENATRGQERKPEAVEAAEKEETEVRKGEGVEKKPAVKSEKPQKKVIIEHLLISGVRVKYGFLTIPLPIDIELHDIGKDSGGATFADAVAKIREALMKSLGIIGDGLGAIGEGASALGEKALSVGADALNGTAEGLNSAIDAVKSLDIEGAGDALEGAGDALKDAGKEIENLGKGAADALKSLF